MILVQITVLPFALEYCIVIIRSNLITLVFYNLQVRSLVGDWKALIIQTLSAMTIACTMTLIITWRLAVVIMAVQPLIIICYYCKRVLLKRMSQKAVKAQDESSKLAAKAFSNLRTATAFSSQARILQLLEKAQEGP